MKTGEMTAEELLAQYDEEHHDYIEGRAHKWETVRAEILARLNAGVAPEVSKPPCHVCGLPMKVKGWKCSCGATTGCSEAQPLQPRCLRCHNGTSLVLRDYEDGLRLACGANCGLIVDVDAATGLEFSLSKFAQFFSASPAMPGPFADGWRGKVISPETLADNFLNSNFWLATETHSDEVEAIAELLRNYAKHLAAPAPVSGEGRE